MSTPVRKILIDIKDLKQQQDKMNPFEYHTKMIDRYSNLCAKEPNIAEYQRSFDIHQEAVKKETGEIKKQVLAFMSQESLEGRPDAKYIQQREKYFAFMPQYQELLKKPNLHEALAKACNDILTDIENWQMRYEKIELIKELEKERKDLVSLCRAYRILACLHNETDPQTPVYKAKIENILGEIEQQEKLQKKQQYIAQLENELRQVQQKTYATEFARLDTLASCTQKLGHATNDKYLLKKSRELRLQSTLAPNEAIKNAISKSLSDR